MKLLCIDTALASCSVCVYDAVTKTVLAAEQNLMERGHAEALPPMVARVMAKAEIDFGSLTRIAVTTGPGTFTGIRVGLSFARALGLARNIKVLGIDTMKAVQLAVSKGYMNVNIIHQAGNSGFFYFWNEDISTNIELLNLEQIALRLHPAEQTLVGTGAAAVEHFMGREDLQLLPQLDLPLAQNFAAYAADLPDPGHMPDPIYLREADAKPQKQALRALANVDVHAALLEGDLGVLAKLHALCFDKGWAESEFENLLQTPGYSALLAQSAEVPIGFLLYRTAADEAEITTIGVDPALRRRGAGLALLSHTLAQLKTLGTKALFLDVAASNFEAKALYDKAGFIEVGKRKAYYVRPGAPAEDALVLRLNLE